MFFAARFFSKRDMGDDGESGLEIWPGAANGESGKGLSGEVFLDCQDDTMLYKTRAGSDCCPDMEKAFESPSCACLAVEYSCFLSKSTTTSQINC